MLVLSFRDMATATNSAVTPGAFFDLSPIDPAMRWAPAPPLQPLNGPAVDQMLRGKHVLFLIHGFNVDRDDGYAGYGAFGQEMGPAGALPGLGPPDGPISLLAPGVDLVVPTLWAGDFYSIPLNYPTLLPAIRKTGRYFAQLLSSPTTRISAVSFVTHSLGARVVFEAVQQALSLGGSASLPRFDTAVLTAAAVTDQVFDDPNYALAVKAIRQFVVVSSLRDSVLGGAFPWGNAVEEALWPNDWGEDVALGLSGPTLQPQSPGAGKVRWYPIPPSVGVKHSDYVPAPGAPVAPYPNGWSADRVDVAKIAQAALDGVAPAWPPVCPVPVVDSGDS